MKWNSVLQLFLRFDRVKVLARVERETYREGMDIRGLSVHYDTEVQTRESLADVPARQWIEPAVYNQYHCLEREKSEAPPWRRP